MQCAYSQPVSDKVVPLLFSLFGKILETNAMHCFSASSVFCVTERLSGCKDTDINPNRSLEKASCHFLMTAIRKTALYMLDS